MIMTNVTFPQLIQRGCGIDVHLKVVVATIDGVGIQKETRSFNTFTSCLTEMKEWLLANGITHVAMESTGVYRKPVMRVLEEAIPNVWIVNDRHIKNVPGHKTDKMDSEWICKLLLAGLVKPSYIPPKEQRQLRDLTRYRNKLIQTIAAEKNRMMRVLEDCNIKLSSVVANTSGVTATALIDMLCEGRKLTMADIESVYHKKLSASPQELLEACSGFVEEHHVYMLQMIRKSIAQTQGLIDELSKRIKDILVKYDNVLELLKEIPGFNINVVEDLVSEIGLDMSAFPSEKHLASWAGICPGNNESAGKKSGRITHGNKQVKAVLTEAAWAATRTKNTFFSERYHRISARRGKKRALIAVAHSQLTAAYLILSTGAKYHELGAQYMQAKIEKKRKVYLTAELKKLGYKVSLEKNMEATES